MQIFLFIVDGKPGFRTSLHEAQACLEDHLRDQRDVTDVWWDDEQPYWARKYLYGSSHEDTAVEDAEVNFETTDQLIWPYTLLNTEVDTDDKIDSLAMGGAEMTLTVKTRSGKEQFHRGVPYGEWSEKYLRPQILSHFAMEAVNALIAHGTDKEST